MDQVAYVAPALGCLIGERLRAPLASRTPEEETVEETGGRETEAAGGLRRINVAALSPSAPTPISFFPFLSASPTVATQLPESQVL